MPRHPEKSSSIYVAYERMVMPMDKVSPFVWLNNTGRGRSVACSVELLGMWLGASVNWMRLCVEQLTAAAMCGQVHKMWGNSHSEVPKAAMQRILFSLVRGVHYMHTSEGDNHLSVIACEPLAAAEPGQGTQPCSWR